MIYLVVLREDNSKECLFYGDAKIIGFGIGAQIVKRSAEAYP